MKYRIRVGAKEHSVTLLSRTESALSFEVEGAVYDISVERADETRSAGAVPSPAGRQRAPTGSQRGASGDVRAPMPGLVVELCCTEGAVLAAGDPVIVIEAMKMENCITAAKGGTVKSILVKAGQQVAGGELLVSIE